MRPLRIIRGLGVLLAKIRTIESIRLGIGRNIRGVFRWAKTLLFYSIPPTGNAI
jgi:hypothetical protein